MVFVVTFFVKGVDSFDKVVAGCGVSYILEDIWGILESLVFGCKLVGCSISEIPQDVVHGVLLNSNRTSGFK